MASTLSQAPDTSSSQSPSTDRALDIFEALSDSANGLTLRELFRATGLPQNSIFRITNALHARGYLHRRESDKRFTLSNKLFDLARPRVNEKSLAVCSLEAIRQLRDATGETVQLLVRSGRKGVVLEQASGLHPVKVMGEVGFQVPLYSCAPGKAILAWLPQNEFKDWLGDVKLKRFTETTRSSRKKLTDDLQETRERGYATDLAEGLEGIDGLESHWMNPSSPYSESAQVHNVLEESRSTLANKLKKAPEDIVFTGGATEANNSIISYFSAQLPADKKLALCSFEHPSVVEAST
ncbi:MAG: aminotransferase class V-fold PLP-dependent enzyme, partial [Verrucomicrobiota bacterium]